MATSARVTSLAAIEEFKAHLGEFAIDAANALANIDLQIRRASDWLEERGKFWQREIRERHEDVLRAKSELMQRKDLWGPGRGPGTTDQEAALELAIRRLREAEEKLAHCKRWARVLPQELIDCQGRNNQLGGMLEGDLKRATALLEAKLRALEEYLAITAPSGSGTPAPGGDAPPPDSATASAPAGPAKEAP